MRLCMDSWMMVATCHIIMHILNPCFLSQLSCYDVASTIHQRERLVSVYEEAPGLRLSPRHYPLILRRSGGGVKRGFGFAWVDRRSLI